MATAIRPAATETAAELHPAPWHSLPVVEVERELRVSERGLNWAEARNRLARYGPNDIGAEREVPWWSLLLRQFRDPLIYILLVAAVVTFAVGELTDTAVITAVVIINAMIGFTQEFRARGAMRALARLSTSKLNKAVAERRLPDLTPVVETSTDFDAGWTHEPIVPYDDPE